MRAYIADSGMQPDSADRTETRLLGTSRRARRRRRDARPGLFDEDDLLADLTPELCQERFDRYRPGRAVDTYLGALGQARTILRWCVLSPRRWIAASPMDGVVVPKDAQRRSGKEQLTVDEVLRLHAVCLAAAAEGDESAVAVMVAVTFGIRATEVVSLGSRDVDARGTLLRVKRLKKRGRVVIEHLEIPADVRPHLQRLAARGGPLFPGRDRFWVRYHTRRLCRLAGVTIVSAHGVRGSLGSADRALGAPLEDIRRRYGHDHVAVTQRAYVTEQASATAEHAARLRLLQGGKTAHAGNAGSEMGSEVPRSRRIRSRKPR